MKDYSLKLTRFACHHPTNIQQKTCLDIETTNHFVLLHEFSKKNESCVDLTSRITDKDDWPPLSLLSQPNVSPLRTIITSSPAISTITRPSTSLALSLSTDDNCNSTNPVLPHKSDDTLDIDNTADNSESVSI